jgi:hypothetical protein
MEDHPMQPTPQQREAAARIRENVSRIAGQLAVTAQNARLNVAISTDEMLAIATLAANAREAVAAAPLED